MILRNHRLEVITQHLAWHATRRNAHSSVRITARAFCLGTHCTVGKREYPSTPLKQRCYSAPVTVSCVASAARIWPVRGAQTP